MLSHQVLSREMWLNSLVLKQEVSEHFLLALRNVTAACKPTDEGIPYPLH